jgi:hypothetical protein
LKLRDIVETKLQEAKVAKDRDIVEGKLQETKMSNFYGHRSKESFKASGYIGKHPKPGSEEHFVKLTDSIMDHVRDGHYDHPRVEKAVDSLDHHFPGMDRYISAGNESLFSHMIGSSTDHLQHYKDHYMPKDHKFAESNPHFKNYQKAIASWPKAVEAGAKFHSHWKEHAKKHGLE